jgi:hypothetical protein
VEGAAEAAEAAAGVVALPLEAGAEEAEVTAAGVALPLEAGAATAAAALPLEAEEAEAEGVEQAEAFQPVVAAVALRVLRAAALVEAVALRRVPRAAAEAAVATEVVPTAAALPWSRPAAAEVEARAALASCGVARALGSTAHEAVAWSNAADAVVL